MLLRYVYLAPRFGRREPCRMAAPYYNAQNKKEKRKKKKETFLLRYYKISENLS